MIDVNLDLLDIAVGKLIANMDPDVRVCDVMTVEEHREMKRAFECVRDLHDRMHGMTPRNPPEADIAAECVNRYPRERPQP